jgi:hypothetical protein
MLSKQSLELKENFSKRKTELDKCTKPPPSKEPRIETETDGGKEEVVSSFNTYQYWKDPLPDISLELEQNIASPHSL